MKIVKKQNWSNVQISKYLFLLLALGSKNSVGMEVQCIQKECEMCLPMDSPLVLTAAESAAINNDFSDNSTIIIKKWSESEPVTYNNIPNKKDEKRIRRLKRFEQAAQDAASKSDVCLICKKLEMDNWSECLECKRKYKGKRKYTLFSHYIKEHHPVGDVIYKYSSSDSCLVCNKEMKSGILFTHMTSKSHVLSFLTNKHLKSCKKNWTNGANK